MLLFLEPVFALFEFGADASYLGGTMTENATVLTNTTTTNSKFNAGMLSAYGHVTFGIPKVFTVGIGPQLAVAPGSQNNLAASIHKNNLTVARYGADAKFQLEMLPYVSPFVRAAFGRNALSVTTESNGSTATTKSEFSGSSYYYNLLAGVQIPLGTMFALVVQGGYTGSTGATGTVTTTVDGGASGSSSSSYASELSYSGFMFGAGVRWSL